VEGKEEVHQPARTWQMTAESESLRMRSWVVQEIGLRRITALLSLVSSCDLLILISG
jgi:hypothetical protein